jgi:hypothetical protein
MPRYPFFNAFSDLAIPGPRKIKPIDKLPKLIVVHRFKLKPALAVIQEKIIALEYWSTGVLAQWDNKNQN